MYGPFDSIEETENGYIVYGKYVKPVKFGEYETKQYKVELPRTAKITKREEGVYVEVDGLSWLDTIPFNSKFIIPKIENNKMETVIATGTISKEEKDNYVKHKFYGYYVEVENGEIKNVLDGGIYERTVPKEEIQHELIAPAKIIKGYNELTETEKEELASTTPPELLVHLDRAGRTDLVSRVIAKMLETDPLSVVELPEELIEKYVLNEDDEIVRTALLENAPVMIEELIRLLKQKSVDAVKLNILRERYREEVLEDKQLQREINEERKEEKDWIKREEERRRREHARKTLEMYKDVISKVLGVTLPLVVTAVETGVISRELGREESQEVTREVTEEATS